MSIAPARDAADRRTQVLVLVGVIVVAANLRSALTTVGPLIPTIRADVGVSNVALGLLGTLPVLAFALVSPFAPLLGRRFGLGRTLGGSMVVLAVGIVVRSSGGFSLVLAGTVLLGVGIALGNVLVPALIKRTFPDRAGPLTSMYGAVIVLVATVAAGVAVPVAEAFGWRTSLGVWAIPAVLAAVIVGLAVALDSRGTVSEVVTEAEDDVSAVPLPGSGSMLRQRTAWHVTAYMGLQSALFYIVLAWLPDILLVKGLSDAQAGFMVSVLNIGGLVGILTFPASAGRWTDQRGLAVVTGLLMAVGSALLLLPTGAVAFVAAALFGIGSGGSFGLSMAFFVLRTDSADDAASLSGMAQTWGYLVSAAGPIALGLLNEITGSWTIPTVVLLVGSLGTAVAGYAAGQDRIIGANSTLRSWN